MQNSSKIMNRTKIEYLKRLAFKIMSEVLPSYQNIYIYIYIKQKSVIVCFATCNSLSEVLLCYQIYIIKSVCIGLGVFITEK
jgi:hypothetical protein